MTPESALAPKRRRRRVPALVRRGATMLGLAAVLVAAAATPALANDGGVLAAPANLQEVIGNLRAWLVGILVALATLFLTVGGVRYLSAGGDPGQVAKAKEAVRNAAVGYGLAVLAPLIVSALQSIVG
jgi:Type IV secretion system pilin